MPVYQYPIASQATLTVVVSPLVTCKVVVSTPLFGWHIAGSLIAVLDETIVQKAFTNAFGNATA